MLNNNKYNLAHSFSMKRMVQTMLLYSILFLSSCGNKQSEENGHQKFSVLQISPESVEIKESYSASIQGRRDIDIYPQVSGRITELRVTEGQRVQKGEVLFIIDQVPYEAAWNKAKADVKAAEAQAKTARLEWESKRQLFAKQIVSEYDLTTAQNMLEVAEATLEQMKALELNARNNLSYTEVKSPADGVVGILPYREGALVGTSIAEPLTTISDNSEIYVYFSMTENQLPNANRLLLSGGIGNVIIPRKEVNAIVIPQVATTELQDKILAYKVSDDNRVKSVELSVEDLKDGKRYIVRSGLSAGDVIVTEGVGMLRDRMQIDRKDEKTERRD